MGGVYGYDGVGIYHRREFGIPWIAPGNQGAIGFDGQRAFAASGDLDDVIDSRGDFDLAKSIATPANDPTRTQQCQGMIFPCTDGDYISQSGGHDGLAGGIVTPRHYGTIAPQCDGVTITAVDRDHIGKLGRDIDLAMAVAPPRRHRAIGAQGEGKARPGPNGADIGLGVGGNYTFAVKVFAPGIEIAVFIKQIGIAN